MANIDLNKKKCGYSQYSDLKESYEATKSMINIMFKITLNAQGRKHLLL